MSDPGLRLSIGDDVLYTPVDDGIVLLDFKTRRFYDLETTGARIWSLVMEGKDPEQIADQIAIEYDADKSSIREDILALTAELCVIGLLRRGAV